MAQKYGDMANAEQFEQKPCLVCDDPAPTYSWTDYSGEGYCVKCGTPYQLKWGKPEGRTYPYCDIRAEWIPLMRRFWQETGSPNGAGMFMSGHDYPDQMEGRKKFNKWCKAHESELPKAVESTEQVQA